jgi:hypothetical protein
MTSSVDTPPTYPARLLDKLDEPAARPMPRLRENPIAMAMGRGETAS